MPLDRPLHVLVIDDHVGFGETLEGILSTVGCAVDVALTPYAGITFSDAVRYDLVLVDFRMPQMDGVEALHLLQPRGHRCMLIVSAVADDVPREEARRAGAQGILPKPIDVDRLIGIVEYVGRHVDATEVRLPPSLLEYAAPRVLRPVYR